MNDTGNIAASVAEAPRDVPKLVVTTHPGLGIIGFSGADVASFLQGQLSSDVAALVPGDLQWSSYNSPKGRMLATLCVSRAAPEEFMALIADDLAAAIAKRLQMYVMRAKVAIRDLSDTVALLGVGGATAEAAVASATGITPQRGKVITAGSTSVVGMPDARLVVVTARDQQPETMAKLVAMGAASGAADWDLLAIRAGVPQIRAATQDLFVAQTANWEILGGVSFGKGCYPGQEIVARMQYLGRLKERLARFSAPAGGAQIRPGAHLFGSTFADQPCGTVVNVATTRNGDAELLAVAQLAALAAPPLRVGAPDGPPLTQLDLPYALPAATAPRPKL